MKKLYVIIPLLYIFFLSFPSISAASLNEAKDTLIQNIYWGNKIVQKIDSLAKKISDTSKTNEKFKKSITEKIKILKSKYANNSSKKANKIYLILNYLDIKVQWNLSWVSTTKFSKRMDRILWKKLKTRTSSRVNKLKTLKYKRYKIRKLKN